MKKFVFSFFALSAIVISASAQKLEDGIKFLYYEKYKSAQSVLSKLGGPGSQDAQSIYWYGVSLLDDPSNPNGVAQAKDLFQKALGSGVNSPWVLVGLGHVDLLSSNDITAAKQKFEQAITASVSDKGKYKGKPDPAILDAVGRANADGNTATGDPAYALEKLKQAAELNPTDPDIQINIGLNSLKMSEANSGGDAVTAFTKASTIDPKYAKGFYEIGKIYATQNNTEAVYEWLGKATTADPAYGPAYYAFFKYNTGPKGSLPDATEYLDKYIANSDQDCDVKSLAVELAYKSGKPDDAITKANALDAEGCPSGNANLYAAYAYRSKGDEPTAAKRISKYFELTPSSKVDALTCVDATRLFMHTDQKDSALKYYELGYEVATNKSFKRVFADSAAYLLKDKNLPEQRLVWLKNKMNNSFNEKQAKLDLYNYGIGAIAAGEASKKDAYFATADSVFDAYKKAFPAEQIGYHYQTITALARDTSLAKAEKPVQEYIAFLSKDPAKNGKDIIKYQNVLGAYYANNKKDFVAAANAYSAILAIDPNNAEAKEALELVNAKQKALQDINSLQEEQKKHDEEEKAYQAALDKAKADSINDLQSKGKKDTALPTKNSPGK